MSANTSVLIGELVPLALVVALSPFSVLPPLLLVLHAARPRATGVAFAIGWLVGLGACTAAFVMLPRAFGGAGATQGATADYVRAGIGVVLVLAGLARWLTRHRATRSPAWLNGLAKVGPGLGLMLGIVLPLLNPKFLVANAAAGLGIATAGVGSLGTWVAVLGYTALAASTTVVPVAVYATSPARFDGALARVRDWIERQHAPLTAIILVVIGIVLVAQGFHALATR